MFVLMALAFLIYLVIFFFKSKYMYRTYFKRRVTLSKFRVLVSHFSFHEICNLCVPVMLYYYDKKCFPQSLLFSSFL